MLDITKIIGEDLQTLNSIADELKKVYSDSVDSQIDTDRPENFFWQPFYTKNTYHCDAFDAIARYYFVRQKGRRINEIIIYKEHLSVALREYCKKNSIKIRIKRNIKGLLMGGVTGMLQFLIWLFLDKIQYKLSNSKFCLSWAKDNVLVCETIYYKSNVNENKLHDRHFGEIFSKLETSQSYDVLIFPFFYGLFNYYKLYKNLKKSDSQFIFITSLIKLSDLFYIFKVALSKSGNQKFIIEGVDFTDLKHSSLSKNRFKLSSLISILKYRVNLNLAKKIKADSVSVLKWFEGNEIDRMSILGWNKSKKIQKIIGYYDAFPPKDYLSPYLYKDEKKFRSVPDDYYVISEYIAKNISTLHSNSKVYVTGSMRLKYDSDKSVNLKTTNVLVVLPFDKVQSRYIYDLSTSAFLSQLTNLNYKKMIIRPHPADSNNYKVKGDYLVVDRETPYKDLLNVTDCVIGNSSSAVVDAFFQGKKIGLVAIPGKLSSSPFPSGFDLDRVNEIYNVEDVLSFLCSDNSWFESKCFGMSDINPLVSFKKSLEL